MYVIRLHEDVNLIQYMASEAGKNEEDIAIFLFLSLSVAPRIKTKWLSKKKTNPVKYVTKNLTT